VKRLPVIRADCVAGTLLSGSLEDRMSGRRQCQVTCPKNLTITASEDMPGRRHGGLAPPASPSGTLNARAPSCALDIADANPNGMPSRAVARYLGVTTRAVELDVRAALEKLRAAGACGEDVDAMTAAAFPHAAGNGVV
jgi:hypothetical protein